MSLLIVFRVNAALQSSPGVAAATGSAAVAAAASATAGSFGSPQYKTKKVNLEAGSELLEYYQVIKLLFSRLTFECFTPCHFHSSR